MAPKPRRWSPNGDVLVTSKDNGGDEFFQIYTLKDGRLSLLTAGGKSRNGLGPFSKDGSLIGFSSTERNGTDSDLYVMNPRDPSTNRMVAEVKGGGWGIADFAPDGKAAVVTNFQSVAKTDLHWLDLASGKLVIEAKSISKSFDALEVVKGFSIRVNRGDRIGLVGPNGAGKTTLAAHLAVGWSLAGRRVALLDVDPQGSLSRWAAMRARAQKNDT